MYATILCILSPKLMKKHILKFLSAILLTLIVTLTGCNTSDQTKVQRTEEPLAKEVDIFTVGSSLSPLSFTKNGQVESSKTAIIMPEIAGKILEIKAKVGDRVNKDQELVTLGDSLSTEITDQSYRTALKGIALLQESQGIMWESEQNDWKSALIGYYSAEEAVKTAIKAKDNAEDLYDSQYDALNDSIDEMKEALDEFEQVPGYEENTDYQDLLSKYEQLKSSRDQAEIGHDTQEDQLIFAIDSAKRGLQLAAITVKNLQNKYSLQFIQSDSALLQAKSGADIVALQKTAQIIHSPISGVVTQVQAIQGNSTTPGQILMTVSDLNSLKITTSLNQNESPLIKVGDQVKILTGNTLYTGTIFTISPTLSSKTNKIEVEIKPEKGALITSGSLVDIVFTPNTTSVFIPLKTVTIEDKSYYVKTINDKKEITKVGIEPGRILGEYIEVLEGLNEGDILASSTTTFLQEGDRVAYKIPRL